MCNEFCLRFIPDNMPEEAIAGKRILEVGAYNVNGSCRDRFCKYEPLSYIGIDIKLGPGVDVAIDVMNLELSFGKESLDVIFSTEMIEHIPDWKKAINSMKNVLRVGGYIGLTTRSPGFPYHGYPNDFWRFTEADMRVIFDDYDIIGLEPDPDCGIGVVARKKEATAKSLEGFDVMRVKRRRRRA